MTGRGACCERLCGEEVCGLAFEQTARELQTLYRSVWFFLLIVGLFRERASLPKFHNAWSRNTMICKYGNYTTKAKLN